MANSKAASKATGNLGNNAWLAAMDIPQWHRKTMPLPDSETSSIAPVSEIASQNPASKIPSMGHRSDIESSSERHSLEQRNSAQHELSQNEPGHHESGHHEPGQHELSQRQTEKNQPKQSHSELSQPLSQTATTAKSPDDLVPELAAEPAPVALLAGRPVPLLVIWDSVAESVMAGAGSLPVGAAGELLANIIGAVGLTEDVVAAWSEPPAELMNVAGSAVPQGLLASLNAMAIKPTAIWWFGTESTPRLLESGVQSSADMSMGLPVVLAPSLTELQSNRELKGKLWKLLKPLAERGLWQQ